MCVLTVSDVHGQFANAYQATRLLGAVDRVKALLAKGSDDAVVLAGAKRWKSDDANAKVPIGRD